MTKPTLYDVLKPPTTPFTPYLEKIKPPVTPSPTSPSKPTLYDILKPPTTPFTPYLEKDRIDKPPVTPSKPTTKPQPEPTDTTQKEVLPTTAEIKETQPKTEKQKILDLLKPKTEITKEDIKKMLESKPPALTSISKQEVFIPEGKYQKSTEPKITSRIEELKKETEERRKYAEYPKSLFKTFDPLLKNVEGMRIKYIKSFDPLFETVDVISSKITREPTERELKIPEKEPPLFEIRTPYVDITKPGMYTRGTVSDFMPVKRELTIGEQMFFTLKSEHETFEEKLNKRIEKEVNIPLERLNREIQEDISSGRLTYEEGLKRIEELEEKFSKKYDRIIEEETKKGEKKQAELIEEYKKKYEPSFKKKVITGAILTLPSFVPYGGPVYTGALATRFIAEIPEVIESSQKSGAVELVKGNVPYLIGGVLAGVTVKSISYFGKYKQVSPKIDLEVSKSRALKISPNKWIVESDVKILTKEQSTGKILLSDLKKGYSEVITKTDGATTKSLVDSYLFDLKKKAVIPSIPKEKLLATFEVGRAKGKIILTPSEVPKIWKGTGEYVTRYGEMDALIHKGKFEVVNYIIKKEKYDALQNILVRDVGKPKILNIQLREGILKVERTRFLTKTVTDISPEKKPVLLKRTYGYGLGKTYRPVKFERLISFDNIKTFKSTYKPETNLYKTLSKTPIQEKKLVLASAQASMFPIAAGITKTALTKTQIEKMMIREISPRVFTTSAATTPRLIKIESKNLLKEKPRDIILTKIKSQLKQKELFKPKMKLPTEQVLKSYQITNLIQKQKLDLRGISKQKELMKPLLKKPSPLTHPFFTPKPYNLRPNLPDFIPQIKSDRTQKSKYIKRQRDILKYAKREYKPSLGAIIFKFKIKDFKKLPKSWTGLELRPIISKY